MLLPVTIHDLNASLHHSSTPLLLSSFLVVVGLFVVAKAVWLLWKWHSGTTSGVGRIHPSADLQEKTLQGSRLPPYRTTRELWNSVSNNSAPSSERTPEVKQAVPNLVITPAPQVTAEKAANNGHGQRRLLPPSIYKSEVPASAAKLIMSRHTFRRPTPGAPRRSTLPASRLPQTQTQSSMV